MVDWFTEKYKRFSKLLKKKIKPRLINIAHVAGSVWSFTLALLIIIGWVILGPHYNFSDTWQLVINTATTIVTFLMAFCIQFSQDRDTKEIKMILKSLMNQNKELKDQLEAIEMELEED